MANEFAQYSVGTWQVGSSDTVRFAIVGPLVETGGNRVVRHARAHRRGVKCDSTGPKERTWKFRILFNNSLRESGLADNGRALYPFVLRAMVASFDLQETGNLTLPTVGLVRAKAEEYERVEDPAARDEGSLDVLFVEDNEDALAQATFALPSVRASIAAQAAQTVFSAAREGAHTSEITRARLPTDSPQTSPADLTLQEAAFAIENLMLAPGRALADLQAQVNAARRRLISIAHTQEELADDVGGMLNDPRGSEFWRNLYRQLDTLAKSSDEKFQSRPRFKSFVIDVDLTSLFAIAARFRQDASELLDLNSERVADPFRLERGQVIRIFETSVR